MEGEQNTSQMLNNDSYTYNVNQKKSIQYFDFQEMNFPNSLKG